METNFAARNHHGAGVTNLTGYFYKLGAAGGHGIGDRVDARDGGGLLGWMGVFFTLSFRPHAGRESYGIAAAVAAHKRQSPAADPVHEPSAGEFRIPHRGSVRVSISRPGGRNLHSIQAQLMQSVSLADGETGFSITIDGSKWIGKTTQARDSRRTHSRHTGAERILCHERDGRYARRREKIKREYLSILGGVELATA